jgi:hypothetical protein
MSTTNEPRWTRHPPSAFDIVACWFPESGGAGDQPHMKLRPALVTAVLRDERSGEYACRVAYGTSRLKIVDRRHLDLIIQKPNDLEQWGWRNPPASIWTTLRPFPGRKRFSPAGRAIGRRAQGR